MATPDGLNVFFPVIILMSAAVVMVIGTLLIGKLVRPNNPSEVKQEAYECGEIPIGVAWSNFNVRFYVIALIFIIFDVETALIFPVAAVYKSFVENMQGGLILVSLLLFVGILLSGLVYCWRKGDLDWVKSFQVNAVEQDEGL